MLVLIIKINFKFARIKVIPINNISIHYISKVCVGVKSLFIVVEGNMRIKNIFSLFGDKNTAKIEDNGNYAQIYDGILNIQQNFFNLLKSSPLSKRIKVLSRENFKINLEGSDQSVVVRDTTVFFESVISFWKNNFIDLQGYLKALPGRYIHVDQGQLLKALRKYGLFFDGFLVSDQILLSANDYISIPFQKTISGPLWMSLMSAAVYLANEDLFLPKSGNPKAFLVPAMRCLDTNVEKPWQNGSQSISVEFFSELFDRQFDSFEKCAEYTLLNQIPEGDLNPDLLNRILQYRGATSLSEYDTFFRAAMRKEQGIDLPEAFTSQSIIITDVFARLSEFERFASDAYRWAQISSVPYPNDLELYKWWAFNSSKLSAKTLGLPHDDDSLFVFAAESQALSFLRNVPLDDVLKTVNISSAKRMRQDLCLSDTALRTMRHGEHEIDFEAIGSRIIDSIDRFDVESRDEIAKVNKDIVHSASKAAFSLGMLVLSPLFPPLSIVSVFFGGSVVDTIKSVNKRRQTLKEIQDRPIAALSTWNKIQQSN